ncbi:uncharacterized protein LOC111118402 [Crassostrea virginica]|uniref:Uncharacterized protein LOC111121558 n=1 Tax=Crassostrea virginica TaxID=6565 RepID=A0A8B8CRX7_CRAVI|nr:uncharacterized protein LOC111121558 [Crassostrea virginica]XP_022318592.1 uncharacterized protein LOC111121558 [Crassostrea virginica]
MAEKERSGPFMNGHLNGTMTNGHSDAETDKQSESSTTSSTQNLTSRGLPPVPKIDQPPPLPKDPPRTDKIPPRIRTTRPPSNTVSKFIPENEITIPKDGNLSSYNTEEMVTFFRHMGVEDKIVNHLQRKGLTGKKFSSLRDADLETIGIKNPIVSYFRDRSKSSKKNVPFML